MNAWIHRGIDGRAPRAHRAAGGLAVLALALAGSAAALGKPGSGPRPPERLADTGLYADFATHRLAPDVLSYTPQYPLWSDGARKRRWIRLPAGTSIGAADPDRWVFPIGTQIWKEFAWERRVETRYMERTPSGAWLYATYEWSDDGRDARLVADRGVRGAHEIRPGAKHDIPSVFDCAACHDGRRSDRGSAGEVLGFSTLQLSPDRDPLAPHAETPGPDDVDLSVLVERGLVRDLPAPLAAHPPRVEARNERERAALGYLHANCGACHNDDGPLASLGQSFEYTLRDAHGGEPPAIRTAVDVALRAPPTAGIPALRIAAGAPDASAALHRMRSRNPLVQMPPLGTRCVDDEAVNLVAAWIQDLEKRASIETHPTVQEHRP